MAYRNPDDLEPCGTLAAARRHYRKGEKAKDCPLCAARVRRDTQDRADRQRRAREVRL